MIGKPFYKLESRKKSWYSLQLGTG